MLARVHYPPQSPPRCLLSTTECILVIDNPGHVENNMGVFMEPMFDELIHACEEGVWTYDRATKTNFKIHV
jgi:hypothetical protein